MAIIEIKPKIKIYSGDLLESDCQYIVHQVNCQGEMKSGIAKAIRERYPKVYKEYKGYCDTKEKILGNIQLVPIENNNRYIINLFGQSTFGYDGLRYTSYDAFEEGLRNINKIIPYGTTIGFPYGIGCVRGGANWNVILTMIDEILGQNYNIEIWRLNND